MAKLGISTGTTPNDGTGDSLLLGATKTNENFDELYNLLGDGTSLSGIVTSLTAGANITLSGSTGNVTITGQQTGANVTISDNPPPSPNSGDLWWESDAGRLKVYYSNVWVDSNPAGGNSGGGGGISGINIQDEGSTLSTTATALNFVGSGVVASGIGSTKTITISGGGGSGITTANINADTLNVSGVSTFAGQVNVLANNNLNLGDINDFYLQWNENTQSAALNAAATGNLYFSNAANGAIFLNAGPSNQSGVHLYSSDRVELKHAGNKKLETTTSGVTVTGDVNATSFIGSGADVTGIVTTNITNYGQGFANTSVTNDLQSQVNALGTNLNIIGFYNAAIGVVTSLTVVGETRGYISLGSTLPSVGITTGDYLIVSTGGANVGVASYINSGISTAYPGDWIVGVGNTEWNILSYSQQVVAPRASSADKLKTLRDFSISGDVTANAVQFDGTSNVGLNAALSNNFSANTSGIITAASFYGSGANITGISTLNIVDYSGGSGGGGSIPGINTTGTSFFNQLNVSGISTFIADKVFFKNGGGTPATLQVETGSGGIGNTIRSSSSLDLATNGSAFNLYLDNDTAILAGGTGASQYVSLYGTGAERLKTTSAGINVTGHTETDTINVSGASTFNGNVDVNGHITLDATFGNSQLYMSDENAIHLGSQNDGRLVYTNSGNIVKFDRNGSVGEIEIDATPVTLKHSDSTKLQTSSTGITVNGEVNATSAKVGTALNLQYSNNTSTILHNNLNGQFNIESVSSINLKPGGSPVSIYSSDDILRFKSTTEGADLYGNINVGLSTNTAGFTSTNSVNTPTLTLAHNNPTIAGTSGTTGNIKSIGGAPFYHDGTNWREFVLATGTPVSQPEDTDWDQVIIRNDFDTSLTEQRFGQVVYSASANNVDLVTSPVKVGTKSARIGGPGGPGDGYSLAYPKRSEYDFTGAWTIEGWFYFDSLPTGTGLSGASLFAHTYQWEKTWGLNLEAIGTSLYFKWLNNSSSTHSAAVTSNRGTLLGSLAATVMDNAWAHIALVRKASNGSIHLYVNGTELANTSLDQVLDNDIPTFTTSYEFWFGKCVVSSNHTIRMDGNIDDIRVSTSERYTSNFNPPTTALPITGTGSTTYTPPGSLLGEMSLGTNPTWTGTTGVTASKIATGHYRTTFSSSYTNSTDYIITTSMNDYVPVTTAVGIGVSRFTSHADFFVNRVSDGVGIDTGSLAIDLYKK